MHHTVRNLEVFETWHKHSTHGVSRPLLLHAHDTRVQLLFREYVACTTINVQFYHFIMHADLKEKIPRLFEIPTNILRVIYTCCLSLTLQH